MELCFPNSCRGSRRARALDPTHTRIFRCFSTPSRRRVRRRRPVPRPRSLIPLRASRNDQRPARPARASRHRRWLRRPIRGQVFGLDDVGPVRTATPRSSRLDRRRSRSNRRRSGSLVGLNDDCRETHDSHGSRNSAVVGNYKADDDPDEVRVPRVVVERVDEHVRVRVLVAEPLKPGQCPRMGARPRRRLAQGSL